MPPPAPVPLQAVLVSSVLGPRHHPNISQTPPEEAWQKIERCPTPSGFSVTNII